MSIDTGGPAFPRSESLYPDGTVSDPGEEGLSIRDYFAAKAMQMLLGSEYTNNHGLHGGWMQAMSREAYMVADAMLKAREKSNGS